jgi:type I restriction enzyme S subunit
MSWKKVKLCDVCTIEKGAIGIQKATPGEFPLVVTGEERKSHNEYQFDCEAVIIPLVSGTGHGHASIKRLHFQTGKFALGSILCAVIPRDPKQLSAEYLFRFLELNKENELVARMKGMANVTLPIKEIAQIEIPLPTINDQSDFVDMFKALENQSNFISTELIHQRTLVKKLRQQLLQDAVQGKLVEQNPKDETASELLKKIKAEKEKLIAEKKLKKEKELPPIKPEEIPFEIPENWVWCRGEIVATYIDPQPSHRTPPESTDGVPYIAMSDIRKDGTLDFNSARKVSRTVLEEHQNRYKLQDGDFIFGKIGTIGKPVKLPYPFNYTLSANVILIQPERNLVNRDYLFYFLSSPAAEKNLIENKSTMSYPVFGMGKARNMPIPLPPLAEQNRIVRKLNELMQYCNELEASIKQSELQNEKLLQQVLREALRKEPV